MERAIPLRSVSDQPSSLLFATPQRPLKVRGPRRTLFALGEQKDDVVAFLKAQEHHAVSVSAHLRRFLAVPLAG